MSFPVCKVRRMSTTVKNLINMTSRLKNPTDPKLYAPKKFNIFTSVSFVSERGNIRRGPWLAQEEGLGWRKLVFLAESTSGKEVNTSGKFLAENTSGKIIEESTSGKFLAHLKSPNT